MTACPIRYQRQVPDRKGKIFYTSITSLSHISKWAALLTEMNAMETQEAKIYKALDKMEAVIQHNESDISTWLPLEYDLQMTYGEENVQFSPYMQQLKAEVNDWTREKIAREKPE